MRTSVLSGATQVSPDENDRVSAAAVNRELAGVSDIVLCLPDGGSIPLPDVLVRVLLASSEELAAGHAVTILPSEILLTPMEVGKLLGLSRPFIVRLLDTGDIESRYLPGSRHRVVALSDVLEFQGRRERRGRGRRAIGEVIESEGLHY